MRMMTEGEMMGQYHVPMSLTAREFIHPHRFGEGLKSWEWADSPVTACMSILMTCPTPRGGGDFQESPVMGRWHGHHVVILGDYGEFSDFTDLPEHLQVSLGPWVKADLWPYSAVGEKVPEELRFTDISEALIQQYNLEYGGVGRSVEYQLS